MYIIQRYNNIQGKLINYYSGASTDEPLKVTWFMTWLVRRQSFCRWLNIPYYHITSISFSRFLRLMFTGNFHVTYLYDYCSEIVVSTLSVCQLWWRGGWVEGKPWRWMMETVHWVVKDINVRFARGGTRRQTKNVICSRLAVISKFITTTVRPLLTRCLINPVCSQEPKLA